MKKYSIALLTACLFVAAPGYSQDEQKGASSVAEELSEEAAILRALVEEYKAKASGNPPPQISTEAPIIPPLEKSPSVIMADEPPLVVPAPVDQTLSSLAAEVKQVVNAKPATPTIPPVESIVPTPQTPISAETPKMSGSISSVANLISNPIEPVDSVIPEVKTATDMKEAIANFDPTLGKDETPDMSDFPKLDTPLVVKSEIPSVEEPMSEAAAPVISANDSIILKDEPPVTVEVTLEEDPLFAALAERAKAAAAAEKAGVNPTKSVEVTTPVEMDEPEKVAELEGSTMKQAPIIAEVVTEDPLEQKPEVAKADEMKKTEAPPNPAPTIAKKEAPTTTSSPATDNKPLVVATKKTSPPTGVSKPMPTEAAPANTTVAAVDGPPETTQAPGNPAATARSVTPLKDLGRMLFGPKDGTSRGPIFKRKKKSTSQ